MLIQHGAMEKLSYARQLSIQQNVTFHLEKKEKNPMNSYDRCI